MRDLPELLAAGDAMVFNTTSVVPARLRGRRRDSAGSVTGLFLEEVRGAEAGGAGVWSVLLKSNGRLRAGTTIDLVDETGRPTGDALELLRREGAGWLARFLGPAGAAAEALGRSGATPLPPYILRARREAGVDIADQQDRAWYQTTFAAPDHTGSVAAPTAGLHFDGALLADLRDRGIEVAMLTGDATAEFADVVADAAGLDLDRVYAWTFVRLVLNAVWAAPHAPASDEFRGRMIALAKAFATEPDPAAVGAGVGAGAVPG